MGKEDSSIIEVDLQIFCPSTNTLDSAPGKFGVQIFRKRKSKSFPTQFNVFDGATNPRARESRSNSLYLWEFRHESS
jgi:hypothetical protein